MEKPSDGISAIPTSLAEIGFLLFFILMTAFISKEWISAQAGEEEQDCEQCQREPDEIRVSVSELISKEECRERLDKAVARMRHDEQDRLQELISLEECRGEHERLQERVTELEQRLKESEDVAEAYAALAAITHNPEKPTSEEISKALVGIAEQAEKKGIALTEISKKLAGEGIPVCWKSRSRKRETQRLYDAYVYDDGTTVFKLAKHPDHPGREEEGLAIPGVSDMPDGRVNVNGAGEAARQFEKAAKKIKEYGMKHGSRDLPGHECIHIVRIHNEEEVCGSDGAYEGVRKKLEVYFYKSEVRQTC